MPISLVRIDDRLIHGQIVVGWVNALKANYIIVLNDEVAKNEIQKCLLKIAVPPTIKVDIFSLDEFNYTNESKEISNNKVIIILTNPLDCLRLVKKGFKFEMLNVGGMRHSEGKKEMTKSIFLDDEDIKYFKELNQMGIKVEIKMLSVDKSVNIFECILKGECSIEKS